MALNHVPHSAEATLDAIGDGVLSVDRSGAVAYLNTAGEALTGWARAAAVGRPVDEVFSLVDRTTRARLSNPLVQAMACDAVVGIPADCVLVRPDGGDTPIEDSTSPIHDEAGAVIGAVIVFRHVGAALAQSRIMAHAALHDPLTRLPNRMLLLDRLTTVLALGNRHDRPVAVCFLDVDDFKRINDSLGHAAGDQLLRSIAGKLRSAVRQSDTVSRYGGDEFVVVLSEITDSANIPGIAATLLQAGAGPHQIDGHDLSVTVSLGVALYPRDGLDAATLIANADRAMYGAKHVGAGRYRIFDTVIARAFATR